jgi:hypothetical protein
MPILASILEVVYWIRTSSQVKEPKLEWPQAENNHRNRNENPHATIEPLIPSEVYVPKSNGASMQE